MHGGKELTMIDRQRRRLLAATGTALAVPAAAMAQDGDAIQWKMVTSWPKNSPGPGVTAERLARRIADMSNGRLRIRVYGAGEIVPALAVFDAVSDGVAEMGHTASFFWQGKLPAAAFFTAVPFGFISEEHAAWIEFGGGQALWDELYAPFGIKPWMAGNTGMGMGGWFTREINGLDDIRGLKYRIPGLGGEVLRRLGGVPVTMAPGEILPGLQTGVVDGAEFVGPWSDLGLGFHKVAKYYYWPGFHEPNGTGEALIRSDARDGLPDDLRAIVDNACAVEHALSLAEARWNNAIALETLVREHDVDVRPFPDSVLSAARVAAAEVMAGLGERDDLTRRIRDAWQQARKQAMEWTRLSTQAFLNARQPAAG
jgi:TRAP-type mannitol/chloroaromatic compound transport system substrate-binding protein